MRSHIRSSNCWIRGCASTAPPPSKMPSRKLMSTSSTKYTLHCTKRGVKVADLKMTTYTDQTNSDTRMNLYPCCSFMRVHWKKYSWDVMRTVGVPQMTVFLSHSSAIFLKYYILLLQCSRYLCNFCKEHCSFPRQLIYTQGENTLLLYMAEWSPSADDKM